MLDVERGSTRSHCVENLLWKRLWARLKMDYEMKETIAIATATDASGKT
jgi:hypothetical protein